MNKLETQPVGRLLFNLAIPAITAQLVNALYNVVDRIYIGRIPESGYLALTGVGVAFPIIMVIAAFSALIGMGGSPLAAIEMGKKNQDRAELIMTNALSALLVIGVLLTVIFELIREPMLLAFGASADTLPFASKYLSIYLIGNVFVMLSIGMNAFITTQGFARQGMTTVLIGAVLNIILDPIFIFGFQMGVSGAALATILSQGVSALWVMLFLFGKKTILKLRKQYMKIQLPVLGSIAALGISPFIMQATESLLNIALNTNLQRCGGDLAVGSMTIIASISQFALMPLLGLTQGAQPIISYNYGAGISARVKKAVKLLLISSLSYATLFTLACQLFPAVFIRIFTPDTTLIQTAAKYLPIYVGGTWLMGGQTACQNSFLALGQAKVSLLLALLRKIVLLIPLIYLLAHLFGTIGVFTAQPIADIIAALTTMTIFALKFKKIIAGMPQAT